MEQMTTTAERVSARVAEKIEASGVTVVWLCEKTGIPRSTLIRRLNGLRPFDLNELDRIAEVLRVPVATLIEDAA